MGALPELRVLPLLTMHYLGHCLVPGCFAKRPCCHTARSPKVVSEVPVLANFRIGGSLCIREIKWVSIKDKNWKDCLFKYFWAEICKFISVVLEQKLQWTIFQPSVKTWHEMEEWSNSYSSMWRSHTSMPQLLGAQATFAEEGGSGTLLLYTLVNTNELAQKKSLLLDQKLSALQELK